jgi:hypothetical protein
VRPKTAITALALAGAIALGGCGGGGDSESQSAATAASETTSAQAPQTQAPKPTPPKQRSTGQKPSAQRSTPANAPGTPGEPTPGTKAPAPGVPVTPEGDNSVQTFGEEGEEDQRSQAIADLKAYLAARARGDWAGACKAASVQFAEELEKLIAQAKAKPGAEKPKGCAQTLEALYGKAPPPEGAGVGEVLSFRTRSDGYAYLIFKSPEGVKFIAMANDGGTWKVNTLEPAPFEGGQGEAQ